MQNQAFDGKSVLNIYPRSTPFLFIHSAMGQFAHGQCAEILSYDYS